MVVTGEAGIGGEVFAGADGIFFGEDREDPFGGFFAGVVVRRGGDLGEGNFWIGGGEGGAGDVAETVAPIVVVAGSLGVVVGVEWIEVGPVVREGIEKAFAAAMCDLADE